jgi:hypothetical protein
MAGLAADSRARQGGGGRSSARVWGGSRLGEVGTDGSDK